MGPYASLMRSRATFLAGVLVVAALFGGVTATSVAAATKTTVTWKVSSLTAGQVKSLSAVASTNSPGVKTWSKTGSCTLTPKSRPTKLTMGSTGSCVLMLQIAESGNYPAKTSSKTITGKAYKVGQTGPGGGTIFYVDTTRAAGSRYFEVACTGWQNGCDGNADPDAVWGCYEILITGADGTAIGTGEKNTAYILAGCPDDFSAAYLAADYSNSGETDWFLPSIDELNVLCKWAYGDTVNKVCNNKGAGGLYAKYGGLINVFYWSSSQYGAKGARDQLFYYGNQGLDSKYSGYGVRPIRSF